MDRPRSGRRGPGGPLPEIARAVVAPWNAPLTDAERSLILYGMVVAGFALGAALLRMVASRSEIGPRYRPATTAGTGVAAVAAASYVVLALGFLLGYDHRGGLWVPNDAAVLSWSPRFMDWSVTVPLLVVELIAVSAVTGRLARRLRSIGIAAAFLMILLGYLGGVVIEGGTDPGALATWGSASSVCFAVLDAVIIVTVVKSMPSLPATARGPYRAAMVLLLVVWFVYPVVFGLQGVTEGGEWTTAEQLVLCAADVAAKVGYGVLLGRVARLRTAADALTGLDPHPESVWLDQVKLAGGALPVEPLAPIVSAVPVQHAVPAEHSLPVDR